LFGDKGIAIVIFFIIGLILIIYPLPPIVLDLMFAINLGLSFVILLLSVYVDNPIKFSSYPSLLLFMVYLHLSLIVASVRAILSKGSAGALSDLFGNLILGGTGNFVIGLAIFVVIIVIQYMVITNGQQRIAEVAARFTLDAMPGVVWHFLLIPCHALSGWFYLHWIPCCIFGWYRALCWLVLLCVDTMSQWLV